MSFTQEVQSLSSLFTSMVSDSWCLGRSYSAPSWHSQPPRRCHEKQNPTFYMSVSIFIFIINTTGPMSLPFLELTKYLPSSEPLNLLLHILACCAPSKSGLFPISFRFFLVLLPRWISILCNPIPGAFLTFITVWCVPLSSVPLHCLQFHSAKNTIDVRRKTPLSPFQPDPHLPSTSL